MKIDPEQARLHIDYFLQVWERRHPGMELEPFEIPIRLTAAELRFARESIVQAAETRERIAALMIAHGFTTGHGDTSEDLLRELDKQLTHRFSRALARIVDSRNRLKRERPSV